MRRCKIIQWYKQIFLLQRIKQYIVYANNNIFLSFRSPFTTTEAVVICTIMVFLSGLFVSPLFFSASITKIVSFQNISSNVQGLDLKDIQICQTWSSNTILQAYRVRYQVITCFLQFIFPLLLVVSNEFQLKWNISKM